MSYSYEFEYQIPARIGYHQIGLGEETCCLHKMDTIPSGSISYWVNERSSCSVPGIPRMAILKLENPAAMFPEERYAGSIDPASFFRAQV
jgi:hypothetical protein